MQCLGQCSPILRAVSGLPLEGTEHCGAYELLLYYIFWFVFFSLLGAIFIICILFTTAGVFCVSFSPVIYSAHDQVCYSGQIDRKYHSWSSSQSLQLSLSAYWDYNHMQCSFRARLGSLVAGCSSLAVCLSFSSPEFRCDFVFSCIPLWFCKNDLW